jgi:alkaline phosphatase D
LILAKHLQGGLAMSALRLPGLGPVIGHTTQDSCRLWIQADDPKDGPGTIASHRRTVGVIALVKDPRGKAKIEKGYYFRLQREFDRTGTFVMGKDVTLGRHESDGIPPKLRDVPDVLSPDTFYAVRVGTLSIDDPMPDDESLSDVELDARLPSIENIAPMLLQLPADRCEATFRTFPREDAVAASLSFLIGSCRYPGLLWKVKEADRIFGPMSVHLRDSVHGPAARFTVMVGDQIYADTLNRFIPVGLADTYEEFQERYQTALGLREHARAAAPGADIYDSRRSRNRR